MDTTDSNTGRPCFPWVIRRERIDALSNGAFFGNEIAVGHEGGNGNGTHDEKPQRAVDFERQRNDAEKTLAHESGWVLRSWSEKQI